MSVSSTPSSSSPFKRPWDFRWSKSSWECFFRTPSPLPPTMMWSLVETASGCGIPWPCPSDELILLFHVVSSIFFYLTCGNYLKPGIFILYSLVEYWLTSFTYDTKGGLPAEDYDELQRSSASNAQVEDATGPSFSPRILQKCHGYRG